MKVISNPGTERVIDLLRPLLSEGLRLDMVSPAFSLFAFSEVLDGLLLLSITRLLLLVHVGEQGEVSLNFPRAKKILDRLKRTCPGRDLPDAQACARFDKSTRHGQDMRQARRLLSATVSSIVGKSEERAVVSLFAPGGTHTVKGEIAGVNNFEIVAYLVVLEG